MIESTRTKALPKIIYVWLVYIEGLVYDHFINI